MVVVEQEKGRERSLGSERNTFRCVESNEANKEAFYLETDSVYYDEEQGGNSVMRSCSSSMDPFVRSIGS